jgi:SPP1 gp7 family putative phage head morphogenesis protein
MQTGNINRYANKVRVRLNQVQSIFIEEFKKIPTSRKLVKQITNADQLPFYEYELDERSYQQLELLLRNEVTFLVLDGSATNKPAQFYLDENIEFGVRAGFLDAGNQYKQMVTTARRKGVTSSAGFLGDIDPQRLLNTGAYLTTVNRAQIANWAPIKNMADDTIYQIMQQVRLGVQAGEPPRQVAQRIRKRFDVSAGRAKRIARTEVNKAFNDAKMEATRELASTTGYRSGVIHISALTPRTRQSHAARHGNAYTIEAQDRWWDEGVNRINCLCSTRPVILDSQNNVIAPELIDRLKSQKKVFGIEPSEGD